MPITVAHLRLRYSPLSVNDYRLTRQSPPPLPLHRCPLRAVEDGACQCTSDAASALPDVEMHAFACICVRVCRLMHWMDLLRLHTDYVGLRAVVHGSCSVGVGSWEEGKGRGGGKGGWCG